MIEMFHVLIIAPNTTMVVYGILFGGMHSIFIFMMCTQIEKFHVSIIAPNATLVVYGVLFGGVHPIFISMMCT